MSPGSRKSLARAWVTATHLSGRPGPVVIALPEDMLTSLTDAAPLVRPGAQCTEPSDRCPRHGRREALALLSGGVEAPADH